MYSALVHSLNILPDDTHIFLLRKVFIRDRDRAVKFWLLSNFGYQEMPWPMVFHGNDIGLIPLHIVLQRMRYSRHDLIFLPESVMLDRFIDVFYRPIISPDFIRALKIIRSRCIRKEDRIIRKDKMTPDQMSTLIRTQAALVTDDVKWLDAISTEPLFELSTNQLSLAARFGSIKCFCFLTLNCVQCTQTVLSSAMYGGNTEIIQMCLENQCDVHNDEVMLEAIRGDQTSIVEWLVDIQRATQNTNHVMTAISYGSWLIVNRLFSNLYSQSSINWSYMYHVQHRNTDLRYFVQQILDDPNIYSILKTGINRNQQMIMHCDDVNMIYSRASILDFTNVVFAARNRCHNLLAEITRQKNLNELFDWNLTSIVDYCIRANYSSALMMLHGYGANITESSHLRIAANAGHSHIVNYLCDHGADVNIPNSDGNHLLFHSINNGNVGMAACLIENGADVNAVDSGRNFALSVAARKGLVDIVDILLKHGASANTADPCWKSILKHGVKSMDDDVITCLISVGVCPNDVNKHGWNHLMRASSNGQSDIVEYLIENHACLKAMVPGGRTPLMCAAAKGMKQIVEMLVENAADVNEAQLNGRTALISAVTNGHHEIVSYLLQNGANANDAYINGRSALMLAVAKRHLETVRCLVTHGANIHYSDSNGTTALLLSVQNFSFDIMQFLIEHGANVNAINSCGNSALRIAANKGYINFVQKLIEAGAVVNSNECNSLMIASTNGHECATSCLFSNGTNKNHAAAYETTALTQSNIACYV